MKVIIVNVTRSNELISIEVGNQETILQIKQKIQNFIGVPVHLQTLAVSEWELLNGLDLEDYPIITQGTKIDLTIKSPTQVPVFENRNKIQIFVKFSSKKINMEVDRTDTVRSLKEKIHIIDATPIKRMTLFFSGREMDEEHRHLIDYGICEFSEIIVFLKTMSRLVAEPPSTRLCFVVQTSSSLMNSAKIPIEMRDLSTVNDLREFMLMRKLLPTDEYIFIHKQRIMRDECSLRWHGVENGDYVYVFKGAVSQGVNY